MTASFWVYIFLSSITFQLLFHFRGRRRLLFNSVLFAQEILKELTLQLTLVFTNMVFTEFLNISNKMPRSLQFG